MSDWTPPAAPSRRRAYIVVGACLAAVVAVVLIVVSLQSDDEASSTGSTVVPTIGQIGAPADVATTIPAVAVGDSVAATSGASTVPAPSGAAVNRLLAATGSFTCVAPGSWQPFAEVGVAFAVGEPEGATTCPADVLTLPAGHCSAAPCTEIPADWEVRQLPAVLPEQFFVVVAPSADLDGFEGAARFSCVLVGVRQPAQVLPVDTPTESACSAEPIDPTGTADIPLPPAGSTDIPLPLPPISADIATSG